MHKAPDIRILRAAFAALFITTAAAVMAQSPEAASTSNVAFPEADAHKAAQLTARIIDAPGGTYGYDILSDGKLFVHQLNVPGQSGNRGCATKADAEKLAAFVIEKIKKGEMPPSVTIDELTSLGLLR